jgi:cell division protein FtsB
MKTKIIIIFLLSTFTVFGQSKKEKEQAQKETQAKIDTLTKSNEALTSTNKNLSAKSDSLSKELEKYVALYTVIKDKVVKKDFDPAKMAVIIDSLKAGRDSLTLKVAASAINADAGKKQAAQMDSLRKENTGLLYAVNLLKGGSGTNPLDPKDFTGTWNLILRKIKV